MMEKIISYDGLVAVLRKIENKKELFNIFLYACGTENFDVSKACLDAGIDLNDSSSKGNIIRCLIESRLINYRIIDWLIDNGLDINYRYLGYTALNHACMHNNLEIAAYLIKKGARITKYLNGEYSFAVTDLELSVNTKNRELINLILKCGKYTKKQLREEVKGLNNAVLDGKHEVVKLYLEIFRQYNINPNLYTQKGRMAIHIAVFHADEEMVRLLLENNADPNAKIKKGSFYLKDKNLVTPMDIAIYYNNKKIKAILEEYGAKPYK